MTLFLFLSFYVVTVLAALCVEGIFVLLNWLPSGRGAAVAQAAISFNYTTILDIVFGLSALVGARAAGCLPSQWRAENDAHDERRRRFEKDR